MTTSSSLLSVDGLCVTYSQGRRREPLRAVDDVSFTVHAGETLGVVGESGSGKTTVGRAILGLAPVAAGRIRVAGRDVTALDQRARRALSSELQVVFQDPYSSFNPTRTVGQSLVEMLRPHDVGADEARARAVDLLDLVGLPVDSFDRFPSRFSGGQRQRIAIARALMVQPRLVICDEAVSALDLSVQAQVLNLLTRLQRELDISYLFISHDLAVVRHVSHRIVVLYKGRVMENGMAREVYEQPAHPYTRLLIAAEPVPDPALVLRVQTNAELPLAGTRPGPDACPFVPRCAYATTRCIEERPRLETTPEGVDVACHHWRDVRRLSSSPPAAVYADSQAANNPSA